MHFAAIVLTKGFVCMRPLLTQAPNASFSLEKNVWADFIELQCLLSTDKEISLSDVISMVTEEGPNELNRGSDRASEQDDKVYRAFADVFKFIENRAQILGTAYPFTIVDEDTISVNLESASVEQVLYLFLLYSSNLSLFRKNEQQRLTAAFESAAKYVLQQIYPSHNVEVFGTASSEGNIFHGGKLIERFEKLAQCLHTEVTNVTRRNPRYDRASGDGGLDLVGFIQLDHEHSKVPFIPMCFAQCACSVDKWVEKQGSIKYDTWNQRFERLAPYVELIFVPFSLRGADGKWSDEEADRMTVIPIDRIRFIHIIESNREYLNAFKETDAYQVVNESINEL